MELICKLAQEKGFTPKTVSTQVTFRYYTENGKNLMINDMCKYLLLCEIQYWVQEELNTNLSIYLENSKWIWRINKDDFETWNSENNYKQALEAGLKEILK